MSDASELQLQLGEVIYIALVWRPAGDFVMGSEDPIATSLERPRHTVRLSRGFWIGKTPITQQQWVAITGSALPLFDSSARGLTLPAEGIDWDAARSYCRELTATLHGQGALASDLIADLPTEAQWEFACRAGTSSVWHFGDDASELDGYGWYAGNSGGATHEVAARKPNPCGIFDLYGNVAEWCLDDFTKYSAEDATDPCYFDESGLVKVTRGGDFSCPARECRSASRGSCNRDNPFNESTGLRIVCHERV